MKSVLTPPAGVSGATLCFTAERDLIKTRLLTLFPFICASSLIALYFGISALLVQQGHAQAYRCSNTSPRAALILSDHSQHLLPKQCIQQNFGVNRYLKFFLAVVKMWIVLFSVTMFCLVSRYHL